MCEKSGESSAVVPSSSEETDIIPGYASVEEFTKNGYKTLMEAIKYSNALPSGRDWSFYNTSDSFRKIINDEGNYVLNLMNRMMRTHEIESSIKNRVLDQKLELVIEANDVILEKVANHLDELNGLRTVAPPPIELQTVSAQLPLNGSWNRPNATTFSVNSTAGGNNCIKLLTAKNIVRPQKFFKDKIDNRNLIPWYPRITDKPNSLKPLAIFLEECADRQEYSHPYELELDRFSPTPEQLLEEQPKLPKPLQDTPLIEIDKPEQLDELIETLRTCKEFAVDLEHHSYRSFMGFTCLLQISTEDKDYLIDTLALRDKLHVLNEVFTKNTIVKIFHGADKDIEWLQRDLSVYVVNMFDTHQAAKALQYEGLSLAFLLNKFCKVLPNKTYQLADWRIRPLPNELKAYAREDTHYLIYIYKMLKNELRGKANISGNLLRFVIERSTEICKKRYFKPFFFEGDHLNIYRKCTKMFDNRQMYALEQIAIWRDNLAREEDESLGYVLPSHMLVKIAETLPREMQGILACCHPIPPLVRSNLLALHQIVLKAREQPVEKAIMKDTTGRGVLKNVSKVSRDSSLHGLHDLSNTSGFKNNLPTLLQNKELQADIKVIADTELVIEALSSRSVFGSLSNTNSVFTQRAALKKLRTVPFLSPYQRYKLVKPYVIEEGKQEAAKLDAEKVQEANGPVLENVTEDKTDEERIASIKDHFIQLSLKFNEELQAQKEQEENENTQPQTPLSLFEMGGSRKRKREDESDCFVPNSTGFHNNLHYPTPNVNYNAMQSNSRRNRGRKRKFNEMTDQGQGEQTREDEPRSENKKKKLSKKERKRRQNLRDRPQGQQNAETAQQIQQQQTEAQQQQQTEAPQHQQNQQKQSKRKKRKQRNAQIEQQEKPVKTQRGGFQRFPRTIAKNKTAPNAQGANDNDFSPYDYGSVDFRQFQGGAGSANNGVQIKPKFQPKNRKNQGKRGARSATFANTMSNRGGRQTKNY